MHDVKYRRNAVRLILALVLAWCAAGCGSSDGASFQSLAVAQGRTALFAAIARAGTSIDLAISGIDDPGLAQALNQAAGGRGVTVRLVIDDTAAAGEWIAVLLPTITVRSGNKGGMMAANFAILDNREVLALSSARILSDAFLFLALQDQNLVTDFRNEFNQMHASGFFGAGSDTEGGKTALRAARPLTILGNQVETMFLPQDGVVSRLADQTLRASGGLSLWTRRFATERLIGAFSRAAAAGIDWHLRLGAAGTADTLAHRLFSGADARALAADPDCTVALIDDRQTWPLAAFGGFEAAPGRELGRSDGVLILVRGPFALEIAHAASNLAASLAPDPGFVPAPPLVDSTIAFQELLVSEIGFVRIGNDWSGEFVEIHNATTRWLDLTGYGIIVTNYNRLSEPSRFDFPAGTLLGPRAFFVICGDTTTYSVVDAPWSDIFISASGGFSVSIADAFGRGIDRAGTGTSTFASMGGTVNANLKDISISRNLASPGVPPGSFADSIHTHNVFPAFTSQITANPGAANTASGVYP